jgi:hypothetical protein
LDHSDICTIIKEEKIMATRKKGFYIYDPQNDDFIPISPGGSGEAKVDDITININNNGELQFKPQDISDVNKVWRVSNTGDFTLSTIKEWKVISTIAGEIGNAYTLYILTNNVLVGGVSYKKGFYTWNATDGFVIRSIYIEPDGTTIDYNNSGNLEIKDGSITDDKLDADIKIGSLAQLKSIIKDNVVEAINEIIDNKSKNLSSASTDVQYPTSKLLYTALVEANTSGNKLINSPFQLASDISSSTASAGGSSAYYIANGLWYVRAVFSVLNGKTLSLAAGQTNILTTKTGVNLGNAYRCAMQFSQYTGKKGGVADAVMQATASGVTNIAVCTSAAITLQAGIYSLCGTYYSTNNISF